MARSTLKLAPVRVGLERPWTFREDYRKAVRRHNRRARVAILLLLALMAGGIVLLQPVFAHQSNGLRGLIVAGMFLAAFAAVSGFLMRRARKDCARFHLQCPGCGKDLYGSKRMGVWLEGDTQSIGACPHCKRILQCPRPGIPLAMPAEGAPIPAVIWKRRSRLLRWRVGVLLGGMVLMWTGFIFSSRWLHQAGLHPDMRLLSLIGPRLLIAVPFALIAWILRSSASAAKQEGLACSRCAEPLIGRRIVREEAPLRLTCLACGTLMRVEA